MQEDAVRVSWNTSILHSMVTSEDTYNPLGSLQEILHPLGSFQEIINILVIKTRKSTLGSWLLT